MYDIEALYEAKSPGDAVALLQKYPEARIIAGGSDVLIQIREGKLAGATLVSIQKLDELRGVSLEEEGTLRIGALTSFSHLAEDPLIRKHLPVLGEAGSTIGGPQLRNIATIGGNVCNGATSADSASTLLAFDAMMEYLGPPGPPSSGPSTGGALSPEASFEGVPPNGAPLRVRRGPIREHYVSPGKTSLRPGEILTAILIPRESYENCFGCYIKYAMREALDIATLGCSANVRLSPGGEAPPGGPLIERLRLAYGVAGPVPLRAASAEAAARGKPLTEGVIREAAKAALGDLNPRTSWRATKEFRLHLAEELAVRAITEAARRAGGAL